jgi:hypothetical protein
MKYKQVLKRKLMVVGSLCKLAYAYIPSAQDIAKFFVDTSKETLEGV